MERVLTIPNLLTILRVVLVPAIVYYILREELITVLVITGIAGAADLLDGFIARRYNLTSKLGRILDPSADKIMLISVYLALVYKRIIPLWFGGSILFKDFLIATGVIILAIRRRRTEIDPLFIGKVVVFLQFIVAYIMVVEKAFNISLFSTFLAYPTVALAFAAIISYASLLVHRD